MKRLVIVESPAKAKTIKKYLGKGYQVLASYGHVRDLLPKEGSVDPSNDFAMHYVVIDKNAKHVQAIAKALKDSDELLLATDPDREGEAISYHVCELMKNQGILDSKAVKRVVFHEITKGAIVEAIEHARELSMDLVNAQQARRALDFLVGFNLSPLLWRKIRPGLSAGRVQSPALRMIVERELDIEKFTPQEYWTIHADLSKGKMDFEAKLVEFHSEKLKQFSITDEAVANHMIQVLNQSANGQLKIAKIEKKQRKRNPTAPFTTSTLQQEASRKLGFTAARTMRTAQQLYEGVDIGEGSVGLITYMRTDSVNLAETAIDEIREVIAEKYGAEDLPKEPCIYKTKAKNAQEAHEAIRPTSARIDPEQLTNYLTPDQLKLYTLVWQRTIACQMRHASIDTVSVDFSCGPGNTFRANGSSIAVPGFLKVYEEGKDDAKGDGKEKILPQMKEGEILLVKEIKGDQHFTEPPPRYSEATLVKTMEEHGIGRPSTYATIISTLQHREYTTLEQRRFHPTDVGRIVNRFLTNYFKQYVDYGFTASLEDDLDAVARGERAWKPLMKDFWDPFIHLVKDIEQNVARKDVTQELIDENCPQCAEQLAIRLGKRGRFIGCTKFPDCDYTRSLEDPNKTQTGPEIVEGRQCPLCHSALHIKSGRYGKFIGCSSYPDCKHIEPLEKPENSGVQCPKCKKDNILKRRARSGKIFYSCGGYPDCQYALWHPPHKDPCPVCHWPITMVKTTKRSGTEHVCPQKDCKFSEPYEEESPVE
ncbi:MAG: type I DNA topoisomerase [Gammaproteobacteria bacterium]